ncbi:SDR family NAD(P)-dependent oxidoreductase [Actinophytocola oryzae]|uniref:NAD(P)-dependent dehydrogenase (Short-subunit alcohol dehydrogenase family) n=1 Tax=Actinophytocola oryzae TaxID=502181 RepID=A0A4R7VQI3_9PSEU|nr:SDR family oxidoreductase [Actinophytocola oryzae]TDV51882.1 NAD(P)-dependent dehydrogenase (short-subunit alcohol dehydrogenase family) [Actinophytocola oryzae]
MDLHLTGKIALVTGASRGIGLATARALVAEGATVIAAARNLSDALTDSGAHPRTVDLATPAGPATLVRSVLEEYGDLDILVNNVGGGDAEDLRDFFGYDDAIWQRTFDLNFYSAVRACQAGIDSLVRRRGLVVNVSSSGARMPHTGPVPYTTAKAALNAFSKAFAEEYGGRGVRVVTVSPGPTRTSLWTDPDGFGGAVAAAQGISHADLLTGIAAASGVLSGQMVEPEQVASLIAYLASPQAAGITGHDYLVDGGAVKTA